MAVSLSSAAERQRRYRERRRRGVLIAWAEVAPECVEALISRGRLRPEDSTDARLLGAALARLVAEWAVDES